MNYLTLIVEVEGGLTLSDDPFALIPHHATGAVLTARTRRHPNRLDALLRVQAHNTPDRRYAYIWMVAIEVDQASPPDLEAVWLMGEEGVIESTSIDHFRFLSPTLEEAELLAEIIPAPSRPAWGHVELTISRLEWELPPEADVARERLAEALACFRAELWRPSIVMLGCVAEAIVVDLQNAFERVLRWEDEPAYRKRIRNCGTASDRFRAFERFCRPESYGLTGSQSLQRACEHYHAIRRQRNGCCHPNNHEVGKPTALECFSDLAYLCQNANELTDRFDQMTVGRLS